MVVCNADRPIKQGRREDARGEIIPYQNCWAGRSRFHDLGSLLHLAPVSRHCRVSALFRRGAFESGRASHLHAGSKGWPQAWFAEKPACLKTHVKATSQQRWFRRSSEEAETQQPKVRGATAWSTKMANDCWLFHPHPTGPADCHQHNEASHLARKTVWRGPGPLSHFPFQNKFIPEHDSSYFSRS